MKGEKRQGKRKNTQKEDDLQPRKHQQLVDHLTLSLSPPCNPFITNDATPSPNPIASPALSANPITIATPSPRPEPSRARAEGGSRAKEDKSGGPSAKGDKSDQIPVLYPWATDRRARIHSMKYLLDNKIHTISDEVQCKKCERTFTLEYNLQDKYKEVVEFMAENQHKWHRRAPVEWMSPKLPKCKLCGEEDSCKPLIHEKKKFVNWLFLFLGQLLGSCTLAQLKYFCKHTRVHRTGAKDRLMHSAYFELCNQLNS